MNQIYRNQIKNLLIILIFIFPSFPNIIYCQDKKVNIKISGDVTNVLKEIQKISGIMIKYSDTVKGTVSIDIKNSSVSNSLEIIKEKTGLEYIPIPGNFLMMLEIKKGYFVSKPDAKYFNVGWTEFPKDKDIEEYHKHALNAEYGQKYKIEAWEKFRQRQEKKAKEQVKLQPPLLKTPTLEEIDYKVKYKWTDEDVEKVRKKIKDKKIDLKAILPEPEFQRIKLNDNKFLIKDNKGNKMFEGKSRNADPYIFYGDDSIFYKIKNLDLKGKSISFDNEYKYFIVRDYNKQEVYFYDEYANFLFKKNIKTDEGCDILSKGKIIIHVLSSEGGGPEYGIIWYDGKGEKIYQTNESVRCYSSSRDGEYLLLSSLNSATLINKKTGKLWAFNLENQIRKIELSKNGEYSYFFISTQGLSEMVDMILCVNQKGKFIWEFKSEYNFYLDDTSFINMLGWNRNKVKWSQDNRSFLIYNENNNIILLDAFSGKILKVGIKD